MVVGLEIQYSVCLIPVTMLFYLTALLNPIIKLECTGPHCRSKMHSRFDIFTRNDSYNSYDEWRNGTSSLQSDGTVTLLKLTHGYVKCEENCDDCEDKETAEVKCENYNDTQYKELLATLEKLNEKLPAKYNWTLPSYLKLDCKCKDWCPECDHHNLVSLPGDKDGKLQVQTYWYQLWGDYCFDTQNETWQEGSVESKNNDTMCKLFKRFFIIMTLTVIGFLWLGAVLVIMMFVEYINFHIIFDGKCKFCFCTPCFKKILFTGILTVPFLFMLYIGSELLWLRNMDDLLRDYFEIIGATFKLNYKDTPGVIMFYISMGFAFLSIVATMLSGTTQRHLRTIKNYRRGVEYEGVSWKPHNS